MIFRQQGEYQMPRNSIIIEFSTVRAQLGKNIIVATKLGVEPAGSCSKNSEAGAFD
jgi:hypothetical protein